MSDLVALYVETNQRVQDKLKSEKKLSQAPIEFQDATKVLVELQSIFKKLTLRTKDLWGAYRQTTFSGQYEEVDQEDFNPNTFAEVVQSAENMELLDRYEELVIEFRSIVSRANAPVNCLCCRGNCAGLKVVNIFHTND